MENSEAARYVWEEVFAQACKYMNAKDALTVADAAQQAAIEAFLDPADSEQVLRHATSFKNILPTAR